MAKKSVGFADPPMPHKSALSSKASSSRTIPNGTAESTQGRSSAFGWPWKKKPFASLANIDKSTKSSKPTRNPSTTSSERERRRRNNMPGYKGWFWTQPDQPEPSTSGSKTNPYIPADVSPPPVKRPLQTTNTSAVPIGGGGSPFYPVSSSQSNPVAPQTGIFGSSFYNKASSMWTFGAAADDSATSSRSPMGPPLDSNGNPYRQRGSSSWDDSASAPPSPLAPRPRSDPGLPHDEVSPQQQPWYSSFGSTVYSAAGSVLSNAASRLWAGGSSGQAGGADETAPASPVGSEIDVEANTGSELPPWQFPRRSSASASNVNSRHIHYHAGPVSSIPGSSYPGFAARAHGSYIPQGMRHRKSYTYDPYGAGSSVSFGQPSGPVNTSNATSGWVHYHAHPIGTPSVNGRPSHSHTGARSSASQSRFPELIALGIGISSADITEAQVTRWDAHGGVSQVKYAPTASGLMGTTLNQWRGKEVTSTYIQSLLSGRRVW